MSDNGVGRYISGGAGAIVVLFFFLPWVSVSCAAESLAQLSGADLAGGSQLIPADAKLYLVPLAGLIVLALVYLVSRNEISEEVAAGGQIFAALVGVLVLWLKWSSTSDASEGLDLLDALAGEVTGNSGGSFFSISIDYGLYGSIIGLLFILVGAVASLIATRSEDEYAYDVEFDSSTVTAPSPPPFPDPGEQGSGNFDDFGGSDPRVAGETLSADSSDEPHARPSPKTEVLQKEPEALAWLVVVEGPRAGYEFRLFENTGIGRDADNEIILDDTALSGRHARVKLEEGTFYVYDLASTNGVFLYDKEKSDWEQIYREPLNDGDRLKLGRTILHFMTVETKEEES